MLEWSIDNTQGSTLQYNDILPYDPLNDRDALYCGGDPRELDGNGDPINILDPALAPGALPGPGTGGAELDGSHTTCIIESVENADGSRTDVLLSEIDGRRWV